MGDKNHNRTIKVIKQKGQDSEIDLNWSVNQAQEAYTTLFGYYDEIVKPHTVEEKITISENCKTLTNMLIKTLKMATLLSSEEAVLNSLFDGYDVEIVEKPCVVDLEKLNGKKAALEDLPYKIEI